MAGRPSKLTPGVHQILVEALEAGNYRETACHLAGISQAAFYNWLQKGETHQAEGKHSEYTELVQALNEAEARSEQEALETIRQAARDGQWQAHAWFLERKRPDRWGRRVQVDATMEHSGRVQHELELPEDAARLVEITQIMGEIGVIQPPATNGDSPYGGPLELEAGDAGA